MSIMTADEALAILDQVLQQGRLNDIQELIFRHCWQGLTYTEIAETAGYDAGYIKDVGSKLWQLLSEALGEKISKGTVQAVLKRQARSVLTDVTVPRETASPSEVTEELTSEPIAPLPQSTSFTPPIEDSDRSNLTNDLSSNLTPHQDWGEAVDITAFCGRVSELNILYQWIVSDRCRFISIIGMGGIGKTSLSVKLARQIAENGQTRGRGDTETRRFEFILWRSLRNAPAVEDMLADMIRFLSRERETETHLPSDVSGRVSRLMHYLRSHRCLLILDNMETILRSGDYSGFYREEHQGYRELLTRIAESAHQSCLVITSRENPKDLMILEGETLPVRSLQLSGLTGIDSKTILKSKGTFSGSPEDWQILTDCYAGNPLALKIAATTIQELFDGNITEFLAQGATVFDDIRNLLDQQFNRLSHLEQAVMYWFAIAREPIPFSELQADILTPVIKSQLIEAIGSLRRRSLIEKPATATLNNLSSWNI